jgi:hypothetical protein
MISRPSSLEFATDSVVLRHLKRREMCGKVADEYTMGQASILE